MQWVVVKCILVSLVLDSEVLNVCYIILLLTMYLTHCVWGASERLLGMEGGWVIVNPTHGGL